MTHTVSCAEFERWLDAGADDTAATGMHAHAGTCPRCAAALAAMTAIDAWLTEPPSAPAAFSDQVMTRIGPLEHVRPVMRWNTNPADEMPWWMAILQQPAVVLAAAVAALVMWRGDALLRLTLSGASWLAATIPGASAQAFSGLAAQVFDGSNPAPDGAFKTGELLAVALAVGLTPVLVYASSAVAGWVARQATRNTHLG